MTTMKFYYPSNSEDQEAVLKNLWQQDAISRMIYVRRMSHRGNPYIKGIFTLNEDAADFTPPPEIQCIPLNEDSTIALVDEFRQELSVEDNGVELEKA